MPAPAFLRRPFAVTYEVNPPRGADPRRALAHAHEVAPWVDAFNVTDCPLARLAMNPIPLAATIQQDTGVSTIPHVTCRDRNRLALQGELLGAAHLGVHNVFALTGDPVHVGDHPHARPVFELYANDLIRLVKSLNAGLDDAGQPLEGATEFCVGSALTLTDARPEARATFQRKLDAGVDFFQTQVVFDPHDLDAARSRFETDLPILVGVTPLRHERMLRVFQSIPGVHVPESLARRLLEAPDFAAEANRVVLEVADAVRGRFAGVHVMPVAPDSIQVRALVAALHPASAAPTPLPPPVEAKT